MPTLTWIDATEGAPELADLWEFLAEQVAALSVGRFDTRLHHLTMDTGGVRHAATRLLNDAALLTAAHEAGNGSDAIVLGCWGSPIRAVRAAVPVPVTSLPEGSARAVSSLARRATVVTVAPSLVPIFTSELRELGTCGFDDARPVRAYAPESTHAQVMAAIANPTALIDRFNAVAVEAVDAGADAIVVGCGYLAPIFSAHGYTTVLGHPDVPVYDCNRLAFEHVTSLYELDRFGIGPAPHSYAPPSGARGRAFSAAVRTVADTTTDHAGKVHAC